MASHKRPVAGLQKPSGPYAAALLADGPILFLPGQIGVDPATGKLPDGIVAQTHQAIANLKSLLEASGSDLNHVVRMLVFVTDLSEGDLFNEVYAQYFSADPPVRTRVQVSGLPPGCLVEMEPIAVLKVGAE